MSHIRHHILQSSFTALKMSPAFHQFCPLLTPPDPLATNDLFTFSTLLPFLRCHIIGIIQYVLPFQTGFFHLVTCLSGFCLSCYTLMAPSVSRLSNNDIVHTYHFVRPFTNWRSSWLLPVLAITTQAARSTVWWFMFRQFIWVNIKESNCWISHWE